MRTQIAQKSDINVRTYQKALLHWTAKVQAKEETREDRVKPRIGEICPLFPSEVCSIIPETIFFVWNSVVVKRWHTISISLARGKVV